MPYWVYENWTAEHKAVIHDAACGYCNDGAGCHPNPLGTQNGKWHGPFDSLQTAQEAARATGRQVREHRCVVPGRGKTKRRTKDVPSPRRGLMKSKDQIVNDILYELGKMLEKMKSLPKHTSLNDYINDLSKQGFLPNRIAGMMHAIRKMRNDFTKGRIQLTDKEFSALEANWAAIQEWAVSPGGLGVGPAQPID
jgi:Domain of unknown function (DUF4145)